MACGRCSSGGDTGRACRPETSERAEAEPEAALEAPASRPGGDDRARHPGCSARSATGAPRRSSAGCSRRHPISDYTDPNKATKSIDIKAGVIDESKETTHISIIDAEGNMVAVTTTPTMRVTGKTVVGGGAGFILNDEMDDFSIKPGVPNMYGAIGGDANAIAPGKRMLSSMTPTLVIKDNKPFMVVGTPGGTTIPTSVFQSIVNVVDFNMNADDAVNKPKFHHQWLPDTVEIEKGISTNNNRAVKGDGL